ncbi:hypothetical protein A3C57_02870 [Candidatus Nomurabacteria bacterium RIFCSPHIGHO2_02_FULL_33_12]|uniref:Excinuclease ABC subunit C n=1 Tax=Candidatus Nomurabacteria bacterium RIFCSPLOWO2_01_FULL_33_17 TaxID=1801764 RepID=A0A1F6WMQ9_9BACT|nr:MAG: hypothetical protein A3C57_02870 [Candidatus Nomurabacteria bacterium RIFCSPHIGHO2_02_FULL_33_12]OGI83163.1 MAG: hypothetical protein A2903_01810 [Candidatus Nomurabacteria bacterium RIFCSPLOWO2_01_FULL_33_17]
MNIQDLKKSKLPSTPGVYIFKFGKDILYIGKATNLKDRVKSYFSKELLNMRGMFLVDMVTKASKIDFIQTDSVLEALILEASLIKKHQPKYNTKEKDNKSFNYVCITREKIPKVLVVRGRSLFSSPLVRGRLGGGMYKATFGPFTNSTQLYEAMKIIRRIFPFHDAQSAKKPNYQFYKQLGLVPKINPSQPSLIKEGVAKNPHDKGGMGGFDNYKKNISNLILFFKGKKKKILQNLKKEMMMQARLKNFEQAGIIKKQIFALNHINDVALIKEDLIGASLEQIFLRSSGWLTRPSKKLVPASPPAKGEMPIGRGGAFRIEAYDIAHTSGADMVGAFVVLENGEKQTNEYRIFNIKGFTSSNDAGALGQVISRRLKHIYPNVEHGRDEWQYPDLIVADGNQIQKNVIEKELKKYKLKIPVVAVVKNEKHKARAIIGDMDKIKKYKKDILLANAEVHRYLIRHHRIKRGKTFLKNRL